MSRLEAISIRGVGLWSPGIASYADFLAQEGEPSPSGPEQPKCGIVASRQRRGTSRIARMLCEVADQTARSGGADPETVPTLFASAWGEIDIMVGLLEQIYEGEGQLSPMRFKHSVHNAASGLVSIASKNRSFSTALAAGRQTVEQALVEAWGLLATEEEALLLVLGEDRLPEPLHRYSAHDGLAVGFYLTRAPSDDACGWLEMPRFGAEACAGLDEVSVPARFADSSIVGALRLALALAPAEGADVSAPRNLALSARASVRLHPGVAR